MDSLPPEPPGKPNGCVVLLLHAAVCIIIDRHLYCFWILHTVKQPASLLIKNVYWGKELCVRHSFVAQWYRIHLPVQEMQVQFPCSEGPLEGEMTTRSNTLAWKIPWIEEPGRLQSMELQRVGLSDWAHTVLNARITKVNSNLYFRVAYS